MLIAHATDLTGDDPSAFVHASALAAASSARLITVHGNAPAVGASALPDAAELATRWGRAISHERRCHECCDDVADTVLDALRELRPELVVLGTHGRHGLAALVRAASARASRATSRSRRHSEWRRGFVNAATGA
jgi:nucleotide-binding universal stress UspA family protein